MEPIFRNSNIICNKSSHISDYNLYRSKNIWRKRRISYRFISCFCRFNHIYSLYYVFGLIPELEGLKWVASLIGGIGWLIALRFLYTIGWLKALGLAIIIWIISAIVGYLLTNPSTGPV